jgi:hypothetical protein
MELHTKVTGSTGDLRARASTCFQMVHHMRGMYVLIYLLKPVFSGCMEKHTATDHLSMQMVTSTKESGSMETPSDRERISIPTV